MRKTLLKAAPLVLAACVSNAFADDSSVTLYGILDVGIATVDHSANFAESLPASVDNNTGAYPAAKQARVTGMINGGLSASRWGVKGKEDLGGGSNVFFVLESGFNLPTGQANNNALTQVQGANGVFQNNADSSLTGQLFSRQANVGYTTAGMGAISFGRNYAPAYDVIVANDPLKGSQTFSPLGFSGSQGGALGLTEEMRDDNSIKYDAKFGNVNVRAIYKFGNVAGNNTAGRGTGLNLGYEDTGWGMQFATQSYKDVVQMAGAAYSTTGTATNCTPATNPTACTPVTVVTAVNAQGIKGTLYDTSGWVLAGHFTPAQGLNLKAGYEAYKRKGASDLAANLGGITEGGYAFSTAIGNLANYTGQDKSYKMWWLGGDYAVSQAATVMLGYYNFKLNPFLPTSTATTTTGTDQTERWVSLVLDYNLSKRSDVYAGLNHLSVGGTSTTNLSGGAARPAAELLQTSANVLAVGIRHRF
jgi:predicted porin